MNAPAPQSQGIVRRAIVALSSAVSSYWEAHSTRGKVWLTLGAIALVVDAKLCYEYGITQTTWHGIGFAVLALVFSQLPDGAYEEYAKGNKVAGVFLAILCIPLGAVAYQSHIGYGAGVRMGEIKKAGVQNAKWEDNRETVTQQNVNLAGIEKRAAELDAEMAKLIEMKVGDWAMTVKPSSPQELDGAIQAKQLEVDNEAKRTRCGPLCEKRTNELAHLKKLQEKARDIVSNNAAHQAALEAVGELGYRALQVDKLLVEIGAQPGQLRVARVEVGRRQRGRDEGVSHGVRAG